GPAAPNGAVERGPDLGDADARPVHFDESVLWHCVFFRLSRFGGEVLGGDSVQFAIAPDALEALLLALQARLELQVGQAEPVGLALGILVAVGVAGGGGPAE